MNPESFILAAAKQFLSTPNFQPQRATFIDGQVAVLSFMVRSEEEIAEVAARRPDALALIPTITFLDIDENTGFRHAGSMLGAHYTRSGLERFLNSSNGAEERKVWNALWAGDQPNY